MAKRTRLKVHITESAGTVENGSGAETTISHFWILVQKPKQEESNSCWKDRLADS